MALVYKDRVKQTVDAPTTTNPFDFDSNGATPTGYVAFVDALADADTCIYAAEDTSGNWETGLGTWAEANKTLTRTTILASSNSGSAETFTGTVTVFITADTNNARRAYANRGWIEGCDVSYSSGTVIAIAAGTLEINNKILTAAATTLTSGSTMKDVANNTVTLGNSKAYWVFAYDNSGTLEYRVEDIDGTGDGADVVWDSDLNYFKAATTGAAARRIGKFWTTSAGAIPIFVRSRIGRASSVSIESSASFLVVSGGTQTSYTAVTITPWIQPSDSKIAFSLGILRSSGTAQCSIDASTDGGTSGEARIVTADTATSANEVTVRPLWMPSLGTLYYKVAGTNATGNIVLMGFEFLV